jgi:hypothetical protein
MKKPYTKCTYYETIERPHENTEVKLCGHPDNASGLCRAYGCPRGIRSDCEICSNFYWTDRNILKGFTKDDLGEYFKCDVMFDGTNPKLCGGVYIPSDRTLFRKLKERYVHLRKTKYIKQLRNTHKILTEF